MEQGQHTGVLNGSIGDGGPEVSPYRINPQHSRLIWALMAGRDFPQDTHRISSQFTKRVSFTLGYYILDTHQLRFATRQF
jgi:hypothetical protein